MGVSSDVSGLLAKFSATPLQAVGGSIAFLSSVISVFEFLTGAGGPGSRTAQHDGFFSVFPARILLFLFIAASLGWTVALVGGWLTTRLREGQLVAAHIFTVFGAVFMVACIDWIFALDRDKGGFVLLFIAIFGVSFAIFLAKTNFKLMLESDEAIVAARSGLLLSFSATAALLVVVLQIMQVLP